MSVQTAFFIAILFAVVGLSILYYINAKSALFGAISIFLYTSAYTPLKPVTPLTVFVGAIPGAIPFMLGWVAATNQFGIEAGILFMIQFFWQFPHFWSIGWLQYEEYKKGRFQYASDEYEGYGGSKANYFLHRDYDFDLRCTCFKSYRRFLYLPCNCYNRCIIGLFNAVLCSAAP